MTVRKLTSVVAALIAGLATAYVLAIVSGTTEVSSTPKVAGVALAAPCEAPGCTMPDFGNYYQGIFVSQFTSYANKWAEVSGRGVYSDRTACKLNATTTPGFAATTPPSTCTVSAYRWSNGRWVTTTRRIGTYVWVQPFAIDWSWTWTSGAGWLAMRDDKLVARWEPLMVAT